MKELGLDGESNVGTYERVKNVKADEIIQNHTSKLLNNFNLEVPVESKLLPHIYWLPKLHKNPVKSRFIIAAPNCSIKSLSKVVTKIFKLFLQTNGDLQR